MLNARDIYNIAMALNLTQKQVIEKYCETFIGRDSRIPIVRLKPKGVNRACPLLSGDRCSIHAIEPALKPTVCALFPLGRVMASEAATGDIGSDIGSEKGLGIDLSSGLNAELCRPNEIQYILTPAPCGSLKKKQTVRAWLEMFGIPIEDEFFIKWNKTVFELVMAIRKYDGKAGVTPKVLNMMWGGIYMALYIDYDTQKEFYPQFEVNASKILGLFAGLEGLFCQTGI
jgi:Fe-S-cluster containining protein